MDFQSVLKTAKSTFFSETQKYQSVCQKEVLIDNEACFRAIVEWKKCTGELLVERTEFAPYRYVSFNILSNKKDESVFCYYDSEESLEEIADKIKEGFCSASQILQQ